MTRILTLNGDYKTVVSDADWDWVRTRRWCACAHNASGKPYARTRIDGRTVYLHRAIVARVLGIERLDSARKVDHVDNDTLMNARPNLRIASHYENNVNRKFWTETGYKGVTRHGNRFRARITLGGVERVIGRFATPEEAAQAYDDAAFAAWGEFAWLNDRERYRISDGEDAEIPF